MSKEVIKYRCGHSVETEIFPPMKNFHGKMKRNYFDGWQEWRIAQLEKESCPMCYEKERKEKIEKENKEAQEETQKRNLPQLTGSEKQIAWATTIRIHTLEYVEEFLNKKREWANSAHKEENRLSRNKKVYDMEKEVNKILSITSSKFWIEKRMSLENIENIINNAEVWAENMNIANKKGGLK